MNQSAVLNQMRFFASNVAGLRRRHGMKKKDLAAAIGVTTPTILSIENDGHLSKSMVIGKSIAMLFDVPLDDLLSKDLSNTLTGVETFHVELEGKLGPRYVESSIASFERRRSHQINNGYFNPNVEYEE